MFIDLAEVPAQQPDPVGDLLHAPTLTADGPISESLAIGSALGSTCRGSGNLGWWCWSSAWWPRWRSRSCALRRRRPKSSAAASAASPRTAPPAALVSAPFSDRAEEAGRVHSHRGWNRWLGDRRGGGRQAVDLAKLAGAQLEHRQRLRAGLRNGGSRASRSTRLPTSSTRSARARTSTWSSTPPPRTPSKEGIEVQTHPVEGDPAEAILNVAEKTDADLIVVGNKGMTGARRFLLGSVPNNVSHHAPCSVIIVRTT